MQESDSLDSDLPDIEAPERAARKSVKRRKISRKISTPTKTSDHSSHSDSEESEDKVVTNLNIQKKNPPLKRVAKIKYEQIPTTSNPNEKVNGDLLCSVNEMKITVEVLSRNMKGMDIPI